MRYTLMLYSNEAELVAASPEKIAQGQAAYGAYIDALKEAGVLVDTDWLQPSSAGTTLSLRTGVRVVQDGPYADTKEQLGGYFVINVPDLDIALKWAEQCPAAHYGIVEIRPSAMPVPSI